jgi:hypothetical protein
MRSQLRMAQAGRTADRYICILLSGLKFKKFKQLQESAAKIDVPSEVPIQWSYPGPPERIR